MINLSEWALKHRSLVAYIMIVAVIAGVLSYFRLGRSEDPTFIIKTMVVQAAWPGATIEVRHGDTVLFDASDNPVPGVPQGMSIRGFMDLVGLPRTR